MVVNDVLERTHRTIDRTAVPARAPDEELVARIHDGDDRAMHELLERYRGFARAKGRPYFVAGGDRDDTAQEGMIGLYKAVRDYVPGHGTSFRSFAELCITRQILSAVRTATRHKHVPLNTSVPFDPPADTGPHREVTAAVAIEVGADPLEQLVASDEVRRLRRAVDEVLSAFEIDVLHLYVEGRTYEEIAGSLGRRVKAIDNAIQRIKRKLEPCLVAAGACPR